MIKADNCNANFVYSAAKKGKCERDKSNPCIPLTFLSVPCEFIDN